MVIATAVTRALVPVPSQTFRTVLLTTRACGRRLELDAKEGVKVWSVRLLDKEKGLSMGGVEFGAPPVNPILEVETAGGGQRRKKGMRWMNRRILRQSTKMMVNTRLNLPQPGVGSRGEEG